MKNTCERKYLDILSKVNIDDLYIQQVFSYYRQSYLTNQSSQEFVAHSERVPDDIRTNPRVGLCDRTLGTTIASSRTIEGGALRGCLQRFELIKATGHELFRGCVVFPEVDQNNQFVAAVGYRVAKRIRHWESSIIFWEKPSSEAFITSGMKIVRRLINAQATV